MLPELFQGLILSLILVFDVAIFQSENNVIACGDDLIDDRII
jgi:hypothetical protein